MAQQFLQAFTRSKYWIWCEISNTTYYYSILLLVFYIQHVFYYHCDFTLTLSAAGHCIQDVKLYVGRNISPSVSNWYVRDQALQDNRWSHWWFWSFLLDVILNKENTDQCRAAGGLNILWAMPVKDQSFMLAPNSFKHNETSSVLLFVNPNLSSQLYG